MSQHDYTPPKPSAESDRATLNYLASRVMLDPMLGKLRIVDGYQMEKPRLLRMLAYCAERELTVQPGVYAPRPGVGVLSDAQKASLDKARLARARLAPTA